jgi:hypothetical protein
MFEQLPVGDEHQVCRAELVTLLEWIKEAGELLTRCIEKGQLAEVDGELVDDIRRWFEQLSDEDDVVSDDESTEH